MSDTRVISRHRTRWIALTVAVVLVGFGVVLAVQHRTRGVGAASRAGAQAGAELRSHHARQQADQLAARSPGKTYVVNFWNSWCIPCRQEEPALQTFYAAHRDEPDFAMVGIVRDDDAVADPRLRRGQRDHVAGRVRSERQRRARLRHDRSTRDVRDLADRRRRVRRSRAGHRRRPRGVARRSCEPGASAVEAIVGAVARARGRRRDRRRGAGRRVRARATRPRRARGAPRRTSSRARCARASRSPTATRRSRARSAPTS